MFDLLQKTSKYEGFFFSETEGSPVTIRYEEVTKYWFKGAEITQGEYEAIVSKSKVCQIVMEAVDDYRQSQVPVQQSQHQQRQIVI